MPRLPRLFVPGQTHHVVQRGNNRGAIFFEDADRRLYLGWLAEALESQGCALHAYVLMTNHVHLLLTSGETTVLPKVLQSLGRRYVRHVNDSYRRSGTLWEGRYKSTVIDSEAYLLACYRYVEANPLRAGMVAAAEDHPWSSYRRNALGHADPLVTEHPVFTALGPTPEARNQAYAALFRQTLDADLLAAIRDATQRSWVLGSDRFQKEIAQALQRRTTPPKRGRPPKTEDLSNDITKEQPTLL
jgi:putative transposase